MERIADYTVQKQLYVSPFGSEILLASTNEGRQVILKKLCKMQIDSQQLDNELTAGKVLHHPHIVQMSANFEENNYLYMVLEYHEGTDLFGFLEERGFAPLEEKEVKHIFRQLAEALHYIHAQGIAHLDLKFENVLIDQQMNVKMIDFGLCETNLCKGTLVSRMCGSTDYISPEILRQTPYCGPKADVWALGTILYGLFFSELPFSFEERCKALRRMQPHPALKFPTNNRDIPDSLRDLIQKMLALEPEGRISIDEVLEHEWCQSDRKKRLSGKSFSLLSVHSSSQLSSSPSSSSSEKGLFKSSSMISLPHSPPTLSPLEMVAPLEQQDNSPLPALPEPLSVFV